MKTIEKYYNKPDFNLDKEESARLQDNQSLCEKQIKTSAFLLDADPRISCVVCGKKLTGGEFKHRGIPFIHCSQCGHIQSKAKPPLGYPFLQNSRYEFKRIYPKLSRQSYKDRKERIYRPKLDWIIDYFNKSDISNDKLKQKKWVELGCGAGYFLSSLEDFGVNDFHGFDADEELVRVANNNLSIANVKYSEQSLEDLLENNPADIYVAFFVLEHIDNSYQFFNKLNQLPSGTVFIFSVPFFGFTNLMEGVFEKNYARSLDGCVHVQTYTDESVNYAMKIAGFDIVSEWIFGQDSDDLKRNLLIHFTSNFPKSLSEKLVRKVSLCVDNFQKSIDQAEFSDQRHFIAIKK